ncbi:MAG: putative aminopeptidase YsdC [Phycisphaerae bacterium]|nr:putative aminopeptidase YsdC [Phycisphaerae bacterium]
MSLSEQTRAFLAELMATGGPAGYEADAQQVVKRYLDARLGDAVAIDIDRNDNLMATVRSGASPRVAMLGHVDTIGLIVTKIEGTGNVRVDRVGNPRAESLIGHMLTIHARGGPVRGVCFRAVDGSEKATAEALAIDCGFANAQAARERIRVGDFVSWPAPCVELNDGRLVGPATDDRVGVVAACEVLIAAAGGSAGPAVTAVSCIQEEGPTRMGAIMTMSRLKPDLIVILDTIGADDYRGCGQIRLGGGPVIARGGSAHNRTSDALIALAERLGMPCQIEPIGRDSGTDLEAALQFAGGNAIGACISIPNRHGHTPNEVFDPSDLSAVVRLVSAFVADLPAGLL